MTELKIPPVPVLKRALVLWATGNGVQRDLHAALLARKLCRSGCFFCGQGGDNPSMAEEVPWEETEVCGCLPSEGSYTDQPWAADDPSPGYREMLPGWRDRQPELVEKVKNRQVNPTRGVYQNTCVKCADVFTVTAVVVATSIEKYGAHAVMNRCKRCRDQAVSRKGARPKNKTLAVAVAEEAV